MYSHAANVLIIISCNFSDSAGDKKKRGRKRREEDSGGSGSEKPRSKRGRKTKASVATKYFLYNHNNVPDDNEFNVMHCYRQKNLSQKTRDCR